MMSYFRQSGKKIIGYCSGGAEKELYFALGVYVFCFVELFIKIISALSCLELLECLVIK